MPESTTPATVQAAEVAPAIAPKPDGATPPAAVAAADKQTGKMTAKEALDGLNRMEFKPSPEWVLDEPDIDLLAQLEQPDDPLAGLYADAPPPEEQKPVETAPVDPAVETALVDEPVTPELTDERVRTNINRKKSDGTFVHGERTRAALTLSHEQQIDYEEAYTRLFGERKAPTSEQAAEAAPAKPEPTAAEIDAQIAEHRVKRKEARDVLDDNLAGELTDKIEDLLASRQDALARDWQRQQAQQASQSTVQQQVNESVGRAEGLYPDAAIPGTPLHTALTKRIAYLQQIGSPLLRETNWPETLAAEQANPLGIPPKFPAKAAAPVATPAKAPSPGTARKPATAVPSPAPGAVTSPPAPPVSKHADIRERMKAAQASGNLRELQKIGAEIEALNRAA